MKHTSRYFRLSLLACMAIFMTNLQAEENASEPEVKNITFLGVESHSVSSALRSQLDIPKGMGLSIGLVVSDSAADKAGLQQHDIILKFDDQWIVNDDQFATLIRSHKPGDIVQLTLLRKNKETTVDVELGSREVSSKTKKWLQSPDAPHAPGLGHFEEFEMDKLQDQLAEIREKAELMGNRALEYIPEIIVKKQLEDGSQLSTSINMGNRSFLIVDDEGSAKMVYQDGECTITILDPDDEVLYEGDKPDEEEMKALPEDIQKRIKLILKQDKPSSLEMLKQIDGKNIKIIINTEEEAMIDHPSDSSEEQHG